MVAKRALSLIIILSSIFLTAGIYAFPAQQGVNPDPPTNPVKLIFIHHSTGENWLNDGNGNLAQALQKNNYYVSDTNYGWGPDSIGDRTDIPNWLEWFNGDNTGEYMQALYNESGIHSYYERTLGDPGGENQVILFKSCFPNSALNGQPDDPPAKGTDLTVANAKYVYNEILKYFQTRPDKLFVVITAPPLMDGRYAKNARAFNNWLVNDWLPENDYPLANVAVFDFYNILTAPENHHRIKEGLVEHLIANPRNTSYFHSEDDHPSQTGNQKATEEFIPMLNVFYNRWQSANSNILPSNSKPLITPTAASGVTNPPMSASLLDDFDLEQFTWEAYLGNPADTHMLCYLSAEYAFSSSQSMQLDFDIPPGGWGTCAKMFATPQDWSDSSGLILYVFSLQPGTVMHVDIYSGAEDDRETYASELTILASEYETWQVIHLIWSDFQRVDWEEDAGQPFTQTEHVTGIAFGFPEITGGNNAGTLWIDDLQLSNQASESISPAPSAQDAQAAPSINPPDEPTESNPLTSAPRSICSGAFIPIGVIALGLFIHKRRPVNRP